MFPRCYLDYMNSGYRAMPSMPNSSLFPGGIAPQGFKPSLNQGSMEESMPGTNLGGEPGMGGTTDMSGGSGMMGGAGVPGGMQMVPGSTSSGAPTPGGTTGPTPAVLPGGIAGPGAGGTPSLFETAPGSPVMLDTQYTQGYLRTQIGKRVRVTFLLGTNTLQDRVGILKTVGISYIVLREPDTNTDVLGDIYSIKFVDIFPPSPTPVPGTT